MIIFHRNKTARRALAVGLLTILLALHPAAAGAGEEVARRIADAGAAYGNGDLKQTLALLGQAITDVQNELSRTLAGFLPGEVEGWTRGEPEVSEFTSESGGLVVFGNLFSAAVPFTRSEGEGRLTVSLTNQPELTGIARANLQMLENPFFRERATEEAEETGELLEAWNLGPLKGMKQWRQAEGAGEVALFVGDVLFQAEGSGLQSFEEMEAVLAGADLDGLAAFAGGATER